MKRNCFYTLVLGVAMLSSLVSCRGSRGVTQTEAEREARRIEQELDRMEARNAQRGAEQF